MQRREFVDWVRGFAVVAMVLWHTADGWLLLPLRAGQSWASLRFVGGLAAPSFIFLAGTGAALAARADRPREPLAIALSRGVEIALLGYLLRFQTWMIDAGAIKQLHLARSWLPLGLGYGLLLYSLRALRSHSPHARPLASAGALLALVGLAQVPWLAPGRLPRLLQVDVLQAIGVSLALLAVGERYARLMQRPWLTIAAGCAIGLVTHLFWSWLPGPLPAALAGYLGKFEPAPGAPPAALFPLVPWAAYACIGAAFGTLLRRDGRDALILHAGLFGALLALVTSESHSYVQHTIASLPFSVHPLRVAFRVGLVLVMLMLGWLWVHGARGRLLIAYGRASLRVYWAHLLIAYGVLGTPWHKHLTMGEWAPRVLLLLGLMWLLARVGAGTPLSRPAQAST